MASRDPKPSDAILNDIAGVWAASRIASRDAKLRVGLMLHDYIHARFREAAGASERARYQLGITRGNAVAEAGRRLSLGVHKVNELIQVAQACVLLGGGIGGCGGLAWTSVRLFRVFVVRGRIDRGRRSKRQREGGGAAEGRVPCYPSETWAVVKGAGAEAPELFRRCASRGAAWQDVLAAVRGLKARTGVPTGGCPFGDGYGPRASLAAPPIAPELRGHAADPDADLAEESLPPVRAGKISPSAALLKGVARNASPRDLAELLLEIVREAEAELGDILLQELPRVVRLRRLTG